MKIRALVLSVLLFNVVGAKSYGQLRNLSLISYDIVSYDIFSDNLIIKLTVKNDSNDFTLRSFSGLVYQNSRPLVRITAANLYIPKNVSTIGVVCKVSRCAGVSVFRLAQCLFPFEISDYTIDVAVGVQYPLAAIEYKEQKGLSLINRIKLR